MRIKLDGLRNILTGKGAIDDVEKYTEIDGVRKYSFEEMRNLYANGVGGAVVKRPVDIASKAGFIIKKGNVDNFNKIFNNVELKLNKALKKALYYQRAYGGALMLFGFGDSDDLKKPRRKIVDNIGFVKVYPQNVVNKTAYINKDKNSPRFGEPEYYSIATPNGLIDVHYSRCYEFCNDYIDDASYEENGKWGDSIFVTCGEEITRLVDALDNLKRALNKQNTLIVKINGLFEAILSGRENDLTKRLSFMRSTMNTMNMIVHDEDESVYNLAGELSSMVDTVKTYMMMLSSVTGIPHRVLFGQQIGGLNNEGTGETTDWRNLLEDIQNSDILPFLYWLGNVIGGDYEFEMKNPIPKTDDEKVKLYNGYADGDSKYLQMGIVTPEEVRNARFTSGELGIKVEEI